MFTKDELPSAYNKRIAKWQEEETFARKVTIDFFKLYDGCEIIKSSSVLAKDYCGIHPSSLASALGMVLFGIFTGLSRLVNNNLAFYPNHETHHQVQRESCFSQQHGQGVPLSLSSFIVNSGSESRGRCSTVYVNVPTLNYFESLSLIFFLLGALALMYRLAIANTSDAETEINSFINLLESLDDTSRDIIFENTILLNKTLGDFKKSLIQIKTKSTDIADIMNEVKDSAIQLSRHLINQDGKGYFTKNLTSEERNDRIKNHLYVNVNAVDEYNFKM
jgi:hypothetical protein